MQRVELNEQQRMKIYTTLAEAGLKLNGVCAGQAVNLLKWLERDHLPIYVLQELADRDVVDHGGRGWESYSGTNSVLVDDEWRIE